MASPRYINYYKYIGSMNLNIITKATKATKATRAAEATKAINNLNIPIKLGFSSLLSLIGTSTFLRHSDWHGCIGLLALIFNT